MCVLHVVDRVLAGLLDRQVEVEVERRVVAAADQEEARRVNADSLDEVVDGDDVALRLLIRRASPLSRRFTS